MEKINVAELLKNYPKGMELDCTMFEQPVKYMGLTKNETYIIAIQTSCGKFFSLTKEGYLYDTADSKCIIYPKGKTSWEGFHGPFKDGDIVATTNGSWIGITEGGEKGCFIPTYCVIKSSDEFEAYFGGKERWSFDRRATEEEKQKLFQAIKDNGYKWNPETKELEKLIQPKFKVGDKIVNKNGITKPFVISQVGDGYYYANDQNAVGIMRIEDQDNYELVPDKFDITTLKPFDKILVRDTDNAMWIAALFSHLREMRFYTVSSWYNQCIPFEGNQHLLGTTNDCDEYYKNWE